VAATGPGSRAAGRHARGFPARGRAGRATRGIGRSGSRPNSAASRSRTSSTAWWPIRSSRRSSADAKAPGRRRARSDRRERGDLVEEPEGDDFAGVGRGCATAALVQPTGERRAAAIWSTRSSRRHRGGDGRVVPSPDDRPTRNSRIEQIVTPRRGLPPSAARGDRFDGPAKELEPRGSTVVGPAPDPLRRLNRSARRWRSLRAEGG